MLASLAGLVGPVGCNPSELGAHGFRTVRLRVVDPAGSPVAGVRVRALYPGGALQAVVSDADGMAVIRLVAESAHVRVDDPAGRFYSVEARDLATARKSSAEESNEITEIPLAPGQALEILVARASGESPIDARARTSSEAANPLRTPLSAHVELFPLDGAVVAGDTDPEGRVVLGPVAPGPVTVLVSAPGHRTECLAFHMSGSRMGRCEVVLSSGGARLVGRVDEDIESRATHVAFRFHGVLVEQALSEKGEFEFLGLPAGPGELEIRRRGRVLFTRAVEVPAAGLDLGLIRPAARR